MRYFWPIYLVTAAVGTAGVYVAAPLARPFVPDALKRAVSAVLSRQPPETEASGAETLSPPSPLSPPSMLPSPRQDAEADELPPALHGIYFAQRGEKPGWGVTRHPTAYYTSDGTRAGQVDGGVLLDFQGTRTSSKGGMVECILHGENIPATPLLVSAADIYLFTGDYRKLSSNQLADLKAYYALGGKIALRKKELLQDAARKNPFFESYQTSYNTLMAHVEQAKELTTRRDKAMDLDRMRVEDKLREMKVAEVRLRKEYDEIHQKFRTWKEQHANELAKPENDASVRQWAQQQAELIPRVPGLAY
jgi:hypothetical protein